MTPKEEFNTSLINLSTEDLDQVLGDNAFKDSSNKSFIEKLDDVFNSFKIQGDTHLEIHKGIGDCSCNNNKKVMALVGNTSRDYFVLSHYENKYSYFGFSKSCKDILLEKPTQLNDFIYFSIKPKETLEYKENREFSGPFLDYKTLCLKEACNMIEIESWLTKYRALNSKALANLERHNNGLKLDSVKFSLTKDFEMLYGKMRIISKLHEKENYFKLQLAEYEKIKDSVSKSKEWFKHQTENDNEYKLFRSMFYDNRELTHYLLKLDKLTLKRDDFKNTLECIRLIEDNNSIVILGTIKNIKNFEVTEKSKNRESSKQCELMLEVDDDHCREHLIYFFAGRVKHLENLHEGQYVKVLARLMSTRINKSGINDFQYSLYGWKVEQLKDKPKKKDSSEDMNLYYKYMMLPTI